MTHLAIGLFEERTATKLNHVPYRGGAPMLQDLLAGQVAAAFVVPGAIAPHVKAGKLRALAVANRRRESLLPDVPTMDEAGLPDFRATIWFGLFAPKKTPDAILDRLHAATQAALEEEKIKAMWIEQGARVEPESRADFARFVGRRRASAGAASPRPPTSRWSNADVLPAEPRWSVSLASVRPASRAPPTSRRGR